MRVHFYFFFLFFIFIVCFLRGSVVTYLSCILKYIFACHPIFRNCPIPPQDGLDLETLSQKADSAMYKAKDLGRNQYYFVQ